MSEETVLYEKVGKVAVITLNRPDARNAQNFTLLDALDACWTRAGEDMSVRAILLRANGKHFSSGHDLNPKDATPPDFENDGMTEYYQIEQKRYYGYTRKWRDNPKPSIAAVQGACVAAGLMLCWPCDLIMASEDAWFCDPTIMMGVGGVEYHGHTWEVGPRKAKEMLFTADRFTAEEMRQLGMVNHVVGNDELQDRAMELAQRISEHELFSLMMAKRSVNQTMDIMGQGAATQTVFDIHALQHSQALTLTKGKSPVLMKDVATLKKNNTRSS